MDRPLGYCLEPFCQARVLRGRCEAHTHRVRDELPIEIRRLYRTKRWLALRREVIRAAASTCAACRQVTLALDVDHVVPHRGNAQLFWRRSNLQALCHACHAQKTNRGE